MNGTYSYEYHPEVGVGQYYIYSDNWGFIASVRHEGIAEHIVTSVNSATTLQAENEALRQRNAELEAERKRMVQTTLGIFAVLPMNRYPDDLQALIKEVGSTQGISGGVIFDTIEEWIENKAKHDITTS